MQGHRWDQSNLWHGMETVLLLCRMIFQNGPLCLERACLSKLALQGKNIERGQQSSLKVYSRMQSHRDCIATPTSWSAITLKNSLRYRLWINTVDWHEVKVRISFIFFKTYKYLPDHPILFGHRCVGGGHAGQDTSRATPFGTANAHKVSRPDEIAGGSCGGFMGDHGIFADSLQDLCNKSSMENIIS